MAVKFSASVRYQPQLGPSEKPYQLYFWIGGCPGFVATRKISVLPGAKEVPRLDFEIPLPPHIQHGRPFLPNDLSLMVEAHCIAVSPDELHNPGVMAAGTAAIPLKDCLKTEHGGAEYTTPLIYQNMVDAKPSFNGIKGKLTVTFAQPDFPMGMNPFLPPDEYTVDFKTEERSPVIGATIEASIAFCATAPCRFDAQVVLPPFRFHKFLVPGQILGAKKCYSPMEESWWERLIDMGIRRAHPELPLEIQRRHLQSIGDERDFIEVFANAIAAPANYWTYFPDETDTNDGMIAGEAFCLSSRAKAGIKNGKVFVPGQDCEDCAKDMELLARSFDKSVQLFKNPFLAKLQDYVGNWVFLQSLCGVNGQQLSDGKAATGDPYENMGYHECGVLMHKGTFVKMIGKINKSRPLFQGWADQFNPDAPFNDNDRPMMLEGTGLIDPRGEGIRNSLLPTYRYLMVNSKPSTAFQYAKLIQWQNPKQVNDFYRVFLQFVVPELYDKGYSNASFVAMSQVNNEWKRGFTYQELMTPHGNIGIRVEPGFTVEQAKVLQKVASFYPPVEPYVSPVPIEECPVRSGLQSKLNQVTQTMKSTGRTQTLNSKVADFYLYYHQITDDRVNDICNVIREKNHIVDVEIEEEPISTGMGGFRIAFHVDLPPTETQRLNTLFPLVIPRKHWHFKSGKKIQKERDVIRI